VSEMPEILFQNEKGEEIKWPNTNAHVAKG
jgi:hypothetical protein